MASLLLVIGIAVCGLSVVVLSIALKIVVGTRVRLREQGIDEAMPAQREEVVVIGAWTIALVIGIALIVWSRTF